METPKEIFKAYDIRGIVGKTFTPEIVEAIGHAIGSEAAARGQKEICIGRDGRLSGPDMAAALARGIRKAGATTITSAVRGIFRDDVATRMEAMRFLNP